MRIIKRVILWFLIAIMTPVYVYRRYRRMRIIGRALVYRIAYKYAQWVEQGAQSEWLSISMPCGVVEYTRPVTLEKIAGALRDR